MTPEAVAAALEEEGCPCAAAGIIVERRDGRWLARLPDGRMAWFARSPEGQEILTREGRILRLLESHCRFRAPRVLHVSAAGWELREPVPGEVDPSALYHRLSADEALQRRLGGEIGEALADQHAIPSGELEGWLPQTVGWPLARPWLEAALDETLPDAGLRRRIGAGLDAWSGAVDRPRSRVLAHCDLGLHNIAVEAGSDALCGIFDYAGAALADREQDFRYLLFDRASEAMLDGALAAYERVTGVRIDRDRVRLFNAACAVGFLAFRKGHPPEEAWCGRTLAEDLAWTDLALARAGF